jgi:hypothetical protein
VWQSIVLSRYEWNKSEWIKDHATGKRRRISRPESEWVVAENPEWGIVESGFWGRVRAIFAQRDARQPRDSRGRLVGAGAGSRGPSRHLLSGFLACGKCGGGFYAVNGRCSYACSWHRDRGNSVCSNAGLISRSRLEGALLEHIQARILTPEAVGFIVERALDLMEHRQEESGGAEKARRTLAETERKLANLVRLAAETGELEQIGEEIRRLKAQRGELEASALAAGVRIDWAEIADRMRARVDRLRGLLVGSRESGRRALRALLGDRRLTIHPSDRGFRLEGFLRLDIGNDDARLSVGKTGRLVSVVAGARSDRLHTAVRPLVVKVHFSS